MKRGFILPRARLTLVLVCFLALAGLARASVEGYLAKAEAGMAKIVEAKAKADAAAKALEGAADPDAHCEALLQLCNARAAYREAVEDVAVTLSMAVADAGEEGKWATKDYGEYGKTVVCIGASLGVKDGMSFVFFALKECGEEDLKTKTLLYRVAADQLHTAVCKDLEALGYASMMLETLYPDAAGLVELKASVEALFSSM